MTDERPEQTQAPDNSWVGASDDLRQARLKHADRLATTYQELIQKQVEAISKFLLLVNAGGAATVLSAMAQGVEDDFRLALTFFVLGIAFVGLAMASSWWIYQSGSRAHASHFTRHVQGEIDWLDYMKAIQPEHWSFSRRLNERCANFIYWASFFLFLGGCIAGAFSIWCH
ncbi:hypothetical protein [Caballeronia cordobensis]|uniref:hypothetical protein n=1 Tax=Caballeronia cordobensis TaxID=1353886 RepID=UPI0006AD715D|nr:hypothetical protein [Caballeronia cordobensis]